MKSIILISILIIFNLSFAKENEMIFEKTFNLCYPYRFAKEKKLLNDNSYDLYYPHLGNSVCRIESFKIDFNQNLDRKGKIKAWKKYKKICSKDGSYQLLLGDAYATYGNFEAAKKVLEEAIKDAKFDTRYHKSLLHEVYLALKERNKSVELAVSLIKEHPNFDGGYLSLAVNLARVGDFVKAKQFLKEALRLNDKTIATYQVLTRVSYELGEYDKVHLYYEKAFLLDPLVTLIDRSSSLSMLDVHIIEKDFNEANAMIAQLLVSDKDIKDDPRFIELQEKFENTFKKRATN